MNLHAQIATRFLCGVAVIALAAGTALAQPMRPPEPPDVGIEQRLDEQVPMDITFRDETGETVVFGDLFDGKPVVLALAYYECPMICGAVMEGMLAVFNESPFTLGQEYQVLTVSIAPVETPELAAMKKKRFMQAYKEEGAEAGWRFLTGDKENIDKLAAAVGFGYEYLPSTEEYAHGAGIMILTPKGKVARYFYGVEYAEQDLRFGLMQAAENRIGSLADEVRLLCYSYDPAVGTYGFMIFKALRIFGTLTVVTMALTIGFLIRFDRRRQRAFAEAQAKPEQPAR